MYLGKIGLSLFSSLRAFANLMAFGLSDISIIIEFLPRLASAKLQSFAVQKVLIIPMAEENIPMAEFVLF